MGFLALDAIGELLSHGDAYVFHSLMNLGNIGVEGFEASGIKQVVTSRRSEYFVLLVCCEVFPLESRIDMLFVERKHFVVRNGSWVR